MSCENEKFEFKIKVPCEYEQLEPFRAFSYRHNDGCWVLARTPFLEEYNCRMWFCLVDGHRAGMLLDGQEMVIWDV